MLEATKNIRAIDLFCGIGGLTKGFINQGIPVVAGIDNDPYCRYGYETSNQTPFILQDIVNVTPNQIQDLFGSSKGIRVLMGCAPCQPYSGLNRKHISPDDMEPLRKFAHLIEKILPEIVSMENVSGLSNTEKYPVFKQFLDTLDRNGYHYSYQIINTADYGIPQKRRRLVLLASLIGEITLINPTHLRKPLTVKDAIGLLPPIRHGQTHKNDPLHKARKLSDLNVSRIKATRKNGGNSSDWEESLLLECHQKQSGKTYKNTVYGRMRWDEPAPTMTTHCIGLGNGRFGHPEQNRAISLREAALIQTFPTDYVFWNPQETIVTSQVAKFIGNAVPVRLGEVIASSIHQHLDDVTSPKSY